LNMIVTPFLAGSFDLIAGEFLASNRKTKTNVERLAQVIQKTCQP
jgi:hypothetical protein